MKYSLRSLMIVVTLICVGMGIFLPWRNHRQFCLERVQLHASKIYTSPVIARNFRFRPDTPEGDAESARIWAAIRKRNEEHRRLQSEYLAAIWQPWLRLSIKDTIAP